MRASERAWASVLAADHPAADSLRWVKDVQMLAARRPAEFNKGHIPAFLAAVLVKELSFQVGVRATARFCAWPSIEMTPRPLG